MYIYMIESNVMGSHMNDVRITGGRDRTFMIEKKRKCGSN